jgi:hypothetical protein
VATTQLSVATTQLSCIYILTWSCRRLSNWISHYSLYLKSQAAFLYNLKKKMNLCIIGTIPFPDSKNKFCVIVLAFVKNIIPRVSKYTSDIKQYLWKQTLSTHKFQSVRLIISHSLWAICILKLIPHSHERRSLIYCSCSSQILALISDRVGIVGSCHCLRISWDS